ncbi:hypothetical protein LUZ60_007060 [Juncus effusus]|nr:hypothetical protein LUZ60_007060 [Juncus effusus]
MPVENSNATKSYELDDSDQFWSTNSWSQFPKVAEEIEEQLRKYKQDVDEVNRKTGGQTGVEFEGTAMIGNTDSLMKAVNSLPELTERKKIIDKHTNIATVLLNHIKERSLDAFCDCENDMLTKGSVDKNVFFNLLKGKGTKEDKLRLAIVYLLSMESPVPSELESVESALRESEVDTSAFQYVKRIKSLNQTFVNSNNSASKNNIVDWAEKLYGQSISVVTAGMKNFLSGGPQLALTRTVDALMDSKPGTDIESYLLLDPRAPRAGAGAVFKGPFREAIVFMIGGGNYVEYRSLMELVQESQDGQARGLWSHGDFECRAVCRAAGGLREENGVRWGSCESGTVVSGVLSRVVRVRSFGSRVDRVSGRSGSGRVGSRVVDLSTFSGRVWVQMGQVGFSVQVIRVSGNSGSGRSGLGSFGSRVVQVSGISGFGSVGFRVFWVSGHLGLGWVEFQVVDLSTFPGRVGFGFGWVGSDVVHYASNSPNESSTRRHFLPNSNLLLLLQSFKFKKSSSAMSRPSSPMPSAQTAQYAAQFLNTALSQRGPAALPYAEDVKWLIRNHLVSLVETFPSLHPKSALFTHNDGRNATLLQADGTFPILFSGVVYNIPAVVWLPEAYPRSPPVVYLSPTRDMVVKPNHPHVDRSGLVHVPYLRSWIFPSSNLVDLVKSLSHLFGLDPPLFTRQAPSPSQTPSPTIRPVVSQPVVTSSSSSLNSSPYGGRLFPAPPPQATRPAPTATEDPTEVFRRNAIGKIVSMVHDDIGSMRKAKEAEIEGLFLTQAELRRREEELNNGLREMMNEKEALEQQLQLILTNTDIIEGWVRENETKKKREIDVDDAFQPADELSRQMVDCTAADLAVEDTIYALDKAVQDGTVPFEGYLKSVRALSREQFFHRALSARIRAAQVSAQVANMAARAPQYG